jgi:hypothetical protein
LRRFGQLFLLRSRSLSGYDRWNDHRRKYMLCGRYHIGGMSAVAGGLPRGWRNLERCRSDLQLSDWQHSDRKRNGNSEWNCDSAHVRKHHGPGGIRRADQLQSGKRAGQLYASSGHDCGQQHGAVYRSGTGSARVGNGGEGMMLGLDGTTYNSQILSAIPTYCPSCPPNLVLSLVQSESSGNQFSNSGAPLTSSEGAVGLFQLEPATAAGLNVDPTTPSGNIQGGLTYLQQLYNQYGNWTEALEAYNEGPGNLAANEAAGVSPVSAGYAASILAASGINDSTSSGDTGDLSDLMDDSSDDSASTDNTMLYLGIAAAVLLVWTVAS